MAKRRHLAAKMWFYAVPISLGIAYSCLFVALHNWPGCCSIAIHERLHFLEVWAREVEGLILCVIHPAEPMWAPWDEVFDTFYWAAIGPLCGLLVGHLAWTAWRLLRRALPSRSNNESAK